MMEWTEAYNLLISWDEWRPYCIEDKYERHQEICAFLQHHVKHESEKADEPK